ncbi:MAG: DUF4115 domain-containing protein [Thalassobaculum sp.]|uniref:RodZ domain-containing protein n=1 Tax=Thalassobaculum sp. TaxID=2022740 RepID=UPI0032EC1D79
MSSQPLSVGDELRRAREDAGLDLADVAAHLRIRSNFLSALEEGRPDALPGITYAIGYVRTYAAFLGLEPDAAVRRFKEEAAGLNSKTQLVFPSPAPEGRVPGLVLMLVAAVLAGGAYGGWYWVSERDGSLRDLVPPVPERLAQLIEGDAPPLPQVASGQRAAGTYADANPAGVAVPRSSPAAVAPAVPAPATGGTSTQPTATPPVAALQPTPQSIPQAVPQAAPVPPTPTASPGPVAQVPVASAPAAQAPAAQAPAAQIPAVEPSVPARSGVPRSAPQDAPRTAAAPTATTSPTASSSLPAAAAADGTPDVTAPPETVADTASAGDPPASDPPASAPPASDTRTATAATGTAASEAAAPAAAPAAGAGDDVPAAPRIASLIGASEAAVPADRTAAGPIDRVMIRATGDSWVQVRDAQGTALFTRVLREGDVYRVPDQAGLRLATGNAGALQILVDGNPAPSLGDFGEVVRNVMLDPTRLSAGTAAGGNR